MEVMVVVNRDNGVCCAGLLYKTRHIFLKRYFILASSDKSWEDDDDDEHSNECMYACNCKSTDFYYLISRCWCVFFVMEEEMVWPCECAHKTQNTT